jgi:hypothetical protein
VAENIAATTNRSRNLFVVIGRTLPVRGTADAACEQRRTSFLRPAPMRDRPSIMETAGPA